MNPTPPIQFAARFHVRLPIEFRFAPDARRSVRSQLEDALKGAFNQAAPRGKDPSVSVTLSRTRTDELIITTPGTNVELLQDGSNQQLHREAFQAADNALRNTQSGFQVVVAPLSGALHGLLGKAKNARKDFLEIDLRKFRFEKVSRH